jgi:Fur family ferric uptake transcriptional regulator
MERSTRQRTLIARILTEAERPLSVLELLALAHAEQPHLGQATVYRALKDLMADGAASLVEIPGSVPRYERRHHGHHHHFHCTACTQVFEVEGCVPGIELLAPEGFTLDSHEIILTGRCAACTDTD